MSTGNHDQVIQAAAQAAVNAVTATAASPTNDMSTAAVVGANRELGANIEQAIAASPLVQNVTNTEPHFWMKRTFWSALYASGTAVCTIMAPVILYLQAHTTSTGATTISGIGLALAFAGGYSAWKAGRPGNVPLGSKPANPVSYRG